MSVKTWVVLSFAAALHAGGALAWQSPTDEIFLEADTTSVDRNSGVAVYRGNVRIVRGAVEIRGDELTFQFEGDDLAAATIIGTPVRFRQSHDGDRPPTEAEAASVTYDTRDGLVRLRGAARVRQGGDEFASDDIRYDTRTERVVAGGEPGSRVQVTIQPRRPQSEETPERDP